MDPTYQVMPDMTPEEFASLKADIAERGVLVPIEIDEDGNVLDGHHRLKACEELGITDYPTVTREGMSEEEKILHAYRLNTARRHLTREQKAEAVKDLLRRDPSLSDRRIAAAVGVSHPTVGRYRRELSGVEQVVIRQLDATHRPSEPEQVVVKLTTPEKPNEVEQVVIRSVAPEEPKPGRATFTCCICGREAPAYYARTRNGRVVNVWGYDPWPMVGEGDCCEACNLSLTDVRDLMPRETWYEHYLGPYWREMLEAAEAAEEAMEKLGRKPGDQGGYDVIEAEFERILADRGIRYDEETDRYIRPKERARIAGDIMTKAIDEAAERGDIDTIMAIRDIAEAMKEEYEAVAQALDARQKELEEEV